jgi:hypothetical protein
MLKLQINNEDTSISFPKLMVAEDGDIVLFTDVSTGVRLNNTPSTKLNWNMNNFKDFNGEVIIKIIGTDNE